MPLFDVLPADLFKPLASPSRRLHADLLLHLHGRMFELTGEAPRRADVVGEIATFLSGWEAGNGPATDETEPDASAADRARALYARLLETGWLVEHKERYLKLVDFDPDAGALLHVLAGIERGEANSYGGAVLHVLTALEGAAFDPAERSENLRNALKGATDFLAHMRTVTVSLRQAEERMMRQPSAREVFRHFFDEFVERHLIRDFRTLHTKDNPFRFRSAILRRVETVAADDALVATLGAAYAREARAPSPVAGEARVRDELARIASVFEAAGRHLEQIDAIVSRIERRVVNAARGADRIVAPSQAGLLEAIARVAASLGDEISVAPALLPRALPLGPPHIPAPRRERVPVDSVLVLDEAADPATILYGKAKEEYVRRTRVTAQSMAAYAERVLGSGSEVRAGDMVLDGVDDFVAFQRLRELPSIFGGALAGRYELVLLPARCRNDWISCQDFVLRRRRESANAP